MAGRRVNLADLAGEPPLQEARVPAFAEVAQRSARVEQVAANPLNTRDVYAQPAKVTELAQSVRLNGQLQPCTVVTRNAFVAIFPEHAAVVQDAAYVQVTGGRRRAAILEVGLMTIDIAVKDAVASSRAAFISATAAENLDRENYDPVEEALTVQLLVRECGSGRDAAQQLSRTAPWVSQRLNLLKLEPELQAALRAGEMPLREARQLHRCSREEQLSALSAWRRLAASRQRADDAREAGRDEDPESDGDGSVGRTPRRRASGVAAAIRRLGGTPVEIAGTLRAQLAPEDWAALVTEVLREDVAAGNEA